VIPSGLRLRLAHSIDPLHFLPFFAQGADVLVATPGRLLDHLKNSAGVADQMANLQTVRAVIVTSAPHTALHNHAHAPTLLQLILDEADQMLEMGFRPDIERIISYLPKARQVR
jgi:ATP-dependent RNA helicase MSS116